MAKEIIDIYVEQGYSFDYNLDFNLYDGSDLEGDYTAYFESQSIGKKQFSIILNAWYLQLSEADTTKLTKNLEEYSIYALEASTGLYHKLVSGRIILDKKIKA